MPVLRERASQKVTGSRGLAYLLGEHTEFPKIEKEVGKEGRQVSRLCGLGEQASWSSKCQDAKDPAPWRWVCYSWSGGRLVSPGEGY